MELNYTKIDLPLSSKENSDEFIMQDLHNSFTNYISNNLTAVITLGVALLGVVGAYGYVFVKSVNEFQIDYHSNSEDYNLSTLFLAGCAATIVLGIICYISIQMGSTLRKEQFIVHAIRVKRDVKTLSEGGILPRKFNPIGKDDDFVIGLFGTIYKICRILVYSIIFSLCIRLIFYFFGSPDITNIPLGLWYIALYAIVLIATHEVCYGFYNKELKTYKNLQEEFKSGYHDGKKQSPQSSDAHECSCPTVASMWVIGIIFLFILVLIVKQIKYMGQ